MVSVPTFCDPGSIVDPIKHIAKNDKVNYLFDTVAGFLIFALFHHFIVVIPSPYSCDSVYRKIH